MTDAQAFKKLASDLCVVLPAAVETIGAACDALVKHASANQTLSDAYAVAKAREVQFDDAKLMKAANNVAKLFGGTMSGNDLFAIYKSNPNALVDSLAKTASHQIGRTVSDNLGVVRGMSKPAVNKFDKEMSAGDIYASIRSQK